ncbi:class I SAM-dependent methyltransferase [Nocardiopsis quinghaiensis]|uniref:class I SAM-dependent methyltransferase n=1 Tax=Nocardiopsis quinghaiensis TaxID=464995 RepID=UPI001CC24CBE|nr:class I SAM-dependent methyltransferase [Nocardiopsis quinghaiensis]
MSTTGVPAFAPEWLALRENADAGARATEPPTLLYGHGRVVADLGCGTGSLGRWLAPRLPGPQRWVLFDRDQALLDLARGAVPATEVVARRLDLASLRAADLVGVTLVVASALLDLFTRAELETLAGAVAVTGCPALFSLSVSGRVDLSPADPLDRAFSEAFNAHQRREGRLGPDAAGVAAAAFGHLGYGVRTYPSPWRLGPGEAELTRAWLRGWVGAAVEQDPSLPGAEYLARRLEECSRGRLEVVVHHTDLLALSRPPESAGAGEVRRP